MDMHSAETGLRFSEMGTEPLAQQFSMNGSGETSIRIPRVPACGLAPSLERKRMQLHVVQILIDIALLLGCFALAGLIVEAETLFADTMMLAYLKLPIFLTIAFYSATYSRKTLTDWKLGTFRAGGALLISSALLAFVAFFAQLEVEFSRLELAVGLILTLIAMMLGRLLVSRWVRANWGPTTSNRLVIEAGGPEVPMPNAYRVNAREHALIPSVDDPAALDRLAQYLLNMDEVLVSCPQADRYAWTEVLKGSGVHGEVISSVARELGAMGIIHHEDCQMSGLLVSTGPLAMRSRIMKRTFDIVVSGLALLFLMPLLLICALLIKLEDGGSVFFKQRRMGRGNRFFSIYKFRSMQESHSDADGNRSASKDDERITKIGRILRKTSIDELPQLINVLRGEMSLVGPRPHALGSQANSKLFWQIDRRYWQRHCLRPGITGLAQVRGFRGATETEEDLTSRLQADLEYIQGWTIWRDLHVLLSTIKVMIHHRAF